MAENPCGSSVNAINKINDSFIDISNANVNAADYTATEPKQKNEQPYSDDKKFNIIMGGMSNLQARVDDTFANQNRVYEYVKENHRKTNQELSVVHERINFFAKTLNEKIQVKSREHQGYENENRQHRTINNRDSNYEAFADEPRNGQYKQGQWSNRPNYANASNSNNNYNGNRKHLSGTVQNGIYRRENNAYQNVNSRNGQNDLQNDQEDVRKTNGSNEMVQNKYRIKRTRYIENKVDIKDCLDSHEDSGNG
ncbi:GATA zinc finger domain-containing protein 14-like [Belonocnema kinseyi]|uniref:GATA zinc finger domain-containing protein 14-like n=1 Tax=Belonocnema kinseyi TaxID=2817044 RepID=UPI00143CC6DD|nr:GATA zinc finger domain-containing protein 14-like [Belonocnema kinseyi]